MKQYTNEELMNVYRNELIMRDKAENTINTYLMHIRIALDGIGCLASDIDYIKLMNYMVGLKGKCVQDTINKKIHAMNDFMAFCKKIGVVNEEIRLQMTKDKDRYKRQKETVRIDSDMYYKIISRNEEFYARNSVSFGRARERAVLNLLIYSGMRRSEIINLKIDDVKTVNIDGGRRLRIAINDSKYNKSRVIYLKEDLISVISDWRIEKKSLQVKSNYFFCSKTGKPLDKKEMDRIAKRVTDRAELYIEDEKVTFTCHQFRHAVGSMLMLKGVSVADIAEFLGDTIEVVIKTYVHSDKATIHAITDVL